MPVEDGMYYGMALAVCLASVNFFCEGNPLHFLKDLDEIWYKGS
jgi:hypothetical protein